MSKYKGKRVLIVGFGMSGVSVAKYMVKQGAKVMVTDMKQRNELTESINAVGDLKIEFDLGKHNPKIFETADLVVVSPGVPLNQKVFEDVRARNIPITSEVELAVGSMKEPMIAITGTNGKTTTTTLVSEMFKADQKTVYTGGNIGTPLLNHIVDGNVGNAVIAEISSFQLDLMERFTPAVSVVTNVEEDHLDRYSTFDNYIASKKRMVTMADRNSYVVLNYDDPIVSGYSTDCPGKVMWFTTLDPMDVGGEFAEKFWGVYLTKNQKQVIGKISGKEETYDLTEFRLLGLHNKENLMAAICAARCLGVSPQAIQKVIKEFKGVEHRLEFVRKKDGVYFFNDSKATNVMSVQRSLASFNHRPVILIAGGKDKDAHFEPLGPLVRQKCKMLILVGEAKEKINRALGDFADTILVGTFEEAVLLAFQKSRSGDIILLSPGCASFDMFRNFEERGEYFKKLVQQL